MKKKTLVVGIVLVLLAVMFGGCTENNAFSSEETSSTVPLSYTVINDDAYGKLSGINWITEAYVEIKNTDTEPGTFRVNFHFRTVEQDYHPSEVGYIVPGESKKIYCTVDTEFGEDIAWNYDIIPPYKS